MRRLKSICSLAIVQNGHFSVLPVALGKPSSRLADESERLDVAGRPQYVLYWMNVPFRIVKTLARPVQISCTPSRGPRTGSFTPYVSPSLSPIGGYTWGKCAEAHT